MPIKIWAAYPGQSQGRIREHEARAVLDQVIYDLDLSPKDITDVLGPCRKAPLVEIRAAIAWELRLRGVSYPMIGRVMNRDHSSIINLVKGLRYGKKEQDRRAAAREADQRVTG